MALRGAPRRERLFDFYNRWLALVRPGDAECFVCPLCLGRFFRVALRGEPPSLSLAHVVPEALGGRLCTLTCTACNNSIGTELESVLVERFRAEDAMRGVGTIQGRLHGEFGSIGVECGIPPEGSPWELTPIQRQSNPAEMNELEDQMRQADANEQPGCFCALNLRYQHQPLRVSAAIYQSAYLHLFAYFGYEVVFDSRYDPLRSQICRPNDAILPQEFVLPPAEWAGANLDNERPHAVMFVGEPSSYIIAFMRFQPLRGLPRVLGVRLPGLGAPAWPTDQRGRTAGILIRVHAECNERNQGNLRGLWKYAQTRYATERREQQEG